MRRALKEDRKETTAVRRLGSDDVGTATKKTPYRYLWIIQG